MKNKYFFSTFQFLDSKVQSNRGSEVYNFVKNICFVPLNVCIFEPKKQKIQKPKYFVSTEKPKLILNMKSKFIAIALLLSVSLTSCDAVDDLLSFNISNETSIKINSTSPINLPSEIITPEVTTNSSAEFENNKTKASLVKDVKLRSLRLAISDPSDKTFTFLKSVHLYISTTDSDEIELAYQDNINATTNTIDLICTDKKLDQYIKADKYKIRTKVTLKETLTKDVTIKAEMKFRVTADPF